MYAAMDYNFTRRMESVLRDYDSILAAFYCRADLEKVLDKYRTAYPDERPSLKNELKIMCEAIGLDADALIKNKKLLDKAPSRADQKAKLLEMLYGMYTEFPRSSDYMRRLIMRLASEYQADTVRLAILKRFIEGCGADCRSVRTESIYKWVYNRLSEKDRQKFDEMSADEKKAAVVSGLSDDIFGTERAGLTSVQELRIIARRMNECIEHPEKYYVFVDNDTRAAVSDFEISGNVRVLFDDFCTVCGAAGEGTLIARLSKALEAGENAVAAEKADALLEPFKKEFRNQIKNKFYTKRNGAAGKVAELYKYDVRDAERALNTDRTLLDICNDLANARFGANGKPKKNIYYFAFMFGMKVPMDGRYAVDEEHDMVKNLFYDYYADDLLRFLEDEYNDPKVTDRNSEPTGEGVNYKNYAECIYVYYLNHAELGTPGERLDKAERLIDRCARNGRGAAPQQRGDGSTQYYRRLAVEEMMEKRENELENFVCTNYTIVNPGNGENTERISVSSEELTAYEKIAEMSRDIIDKYILAYDGLIEPEDKKENLSKKDAEERAIRRSDKLQDVKELRNIAAEWDGYYLLKEKYGDDAGFMRVLEKINDRLSIRNYGMEGFRFAGLNEMLNDADDADDSDSRRVTRSGMLAVMYHDFLLYVEDIGGEYNGLLNMYEEFVARYDGILEAARYQKISPKNLLDMYVVISLYMRVVEEKAEAEGVIVI